MKRLILATGLFAAIACSGLQAQTIDMRASIPFDFRVGTTVLPSGDYVIHHTNGMLFVTDAQSKHSVNALTVSRDNPNTSTVKGTLQFSKYEGEYYLSALWTPNSGVARGLLKSKRETELAKHIGITETATVSLRTK